MQTDRGKTLNKKLVQLLLLLSFFFSITHASLIAIEDDCHHETAQEYVMEQTQASDCGDLCEIHHLFHFMAILDKSHIDFDATHDKLKLVHTLTYYTPPFQEKSIRPPIA